jgi:hypothetical protein
MAQAKFVKPAGKQLGGPTSGISKTIQQMPASGMLVVGVQSGDTKEKLAVGPNDPSAVSIEEIGQDSGSGVRWFQLTGKRAGNVMVEIRGTANSVLDYFQLAIKSPPSVKLPSASSAMDFEFEPDDPKRPGQINLRVYTPLNEPDYIENRLTAVGYGIYLFGCHLYCTGLSMPVFLPDSHIDFTVANAVSINTTIYADRASADVAIDAAPAAPNGVAQYAFYRGAGGALIVPTIFSPATRIGGLKPGTDLGGERGSRQGTCARHGDLLPQDGPQRVRGQPDSTDGEQERTLGFAIFYLLSDELRASPAPSTLCT